MVQETVRFSGIIIGERQRVEYKVRATKTKLYRDLPVFSGYNIVESVATHRLPDGHYQLFANGEKTRFLLNSGRFLSRQ